ncbi:secretoglobin, family 2B, member 27 isoform 1 precursor [Mus musculus]|uniref:ABPBG27 n=4 Tax=Mus musculus TaxID=10090 RepID=Q8R1E9_MOUSE|eukprot:NP_001093934.1 secretoglobin, family 2B, member 27 isoform 1 precursor [Mus musculus]
MKGTLLLLALLVTGELGFQTTEACAPFVGAYVKILGGNRLALNAYLSMFQATAAERVAFEKIQDCFNEEPLTTKLKSPQIMMSILFSSECKAYYPEDSVNKMADMFKLDSIN